MDDPRKPAEGPSLPLQGPHWHRSPSGDQVPLFIPLRLVLQPGGLAVELTRSDMMFGRHSEADIRLQLPDVSRRHCRFVCTEGRWKVYDLNSLNGIFVNGERVQHAALNHRDLLQIGGCTFEVDFPHTQAAMSRAGASARGPEHVLETIADVLPRAVGEVSQHRRAS